MNSWKEKICPACQSEMDWEYCSDCDNGVLSFGDFYIGDDDDWDECPTCDGSADGTTAAIAAPQRINNDPLPTRLLALWRMNDER